MTAALATLLRPGNQHNEIATGTSPSGSVVVSPEGNVVVQQGLETRFVNDPVRYDNQEVYNFTNNSITWAEGQMAYWDPVNAAVSATGFIRIGRVVTATASSVAVVPIRLLKDARGASQSITAAGTALSNSTTATNLATITLPPNYLNAGDRLKIRAQAIVTGHNSTDTLTAALQITPGASGSAVTLVTTGAVQNAANDIIFFDFEVQIRTNGATGTMVGAGMYGDGVPGTATCKPALLASNTIDTTQSQVVGVLGTWSVASSSDSVRMDVLSVELIRA